VPYPLTKKSFRAAATIAFFSFLPAAAIIAAADGHAPHADGQWFMEAAQSLAAGQGFTRMQSPWPGKPTAWHPPLWPFFESLVMRTSVSPISAVHIAGLLFHAATILGAVLLAWLLSGSLRAMWCAGLAVSFWPGALNSIVAGWSEPCAGALIALGCALICMGRKWFWWGVLALSAMPLVRPNFLLFPFLAAAIAAVLRFRSPEPKLKSFGSPAALSLAALLFYVPSAAWVTRNYFALGAFPVLANSGSTLFGSYNPVVAKVGPEFAAMLTVSKTSSQEGVKMLAPRMSEAEVNRYYEQRAKQFLFEHWTAVSGLMLGHLVRALLPQPGSLAYALIYPEWICRVALYTAAIIVMVRKRPPIESWYGLLLGAVALTTAITVTVFEGEQRYLYPLTVLVISFVASGAVPGVAPLSASRCSTSSGAG
jgi:hypothetical protein